MSARPTSGEHESDRSPVDGVNSTHRIRDIRPRSDLPTPAFAPVRDGLTTEFRDGSFDEVPRLKVMAPSVVRTVSKYWFNPSWINDDFVPSANHGEFDSPVWLAAKLTMNADRELDHGCHDEAWALHIPGTVHGDRGGQLRSLLDCIATSTKSATFWRSVPPPVPERRTAPNRPWAGVRNHRLPSPGPSQVRKFVRFVSISVRTVSVNTD